MARKFHLWCAHEKALVSVHHILSIDARSAEKQRALEVGQHGHNDHGRLQTLGRPRHTRFAGFRSTRRLRADDITRQPLLQPQFRQTIGKENIRGKTNKERTAAVAY